MWFVIWEGHGYLAALIPIIIFFLYLVIETVFTGSEDLSSLGVIFCLALSSYLLWIIGKRLNRNNNRRLIDPETNEEVILKSNHSLFFIKIQYWGVILGIASVLLFITELIIWFDS
tara:strand:+ start:114 stop:461 length:348 start_codon:yes stop_codon:yes gene_type:complete